MQGRDWEDTPGSSPQLEAALQGISRPEAQNARLEAENRRFLEQFLRWAYNAHTRGPDEGFLNRPLPHSNKGKTVR